MVKLKNNKIRRLFERHGHQSFADLDTLIFLFFDDGLVAGLRHAASAPLGTRPLIQVHEPYSYIRLHEELFPPDNEFRGNRFIYTDFKGVAALREYLGEHEDVVRRYLQDLSDPL